MDTDILTTASGELDSNRLDYKRTLADLPGPKPLPLFGNIFQMGGQQVHLTLENWIRQYGPAFRFRIYDIPVLVIADHVQITRILRDRPAAFRRSAGTSNIMKELKVDGVFSAEGEDWRKQRKLVMRGLNAEVVRNYFPNMVRLTECMLARWKTTLQQGRQIDLHRDLKAMALDTVVGIAMGYDLGALNNDGNQLQRDIDNIFAALGRRSAAWFPLYRHIKLPIERAAEKSAVDIEKKVAEFIQATRKRMEEQPQLRQKPGNMLEAMIAASEDSDSNFTDKELIGNAITNVVGGEDSTANSIAWMINQLAHNPEAAAKLAAEADAVLGGESVASDWDMMSRFPYLEATHSESQRLRAVSPLTVVVSNEDCVVGDIFVPKDTTIFLSLISAGLDEMQFPQRDAFMPERWIFDEKPDEADDPARKLFPFGGGPRLCPGRFLALTEIKIVVSMLMRNFELELDHNAPPVKQIMNFFMVPDSVPVRLKLRSKPGESR
jgi:cytochrome P450